MIVINKDEENISRLETKTNALQLCGYLKPFSIGFKGLESSKTI